MPYKNYSRKRRYDKKRKRFLRESPLGGEPASDTENIVFLSESEESKPAASVTSVHEQNERKSMAREGQTPALISCQSDDHMAAQAICSLVDRVRTLESPTTSEKQSPLGLFPYRHLIDHNYTAQAAVVGNSNPQGVVIVTGRDTDLSDDSESHTSASQAADQTVHDVAQILTQMQMRKDVSADDSQRLSMAGHEPSKLKKTFFCTFANCNRSYGKSSHLKAHLRSHTGQSVY